MGRSVARLASRAALALALVGVATPAMAQAIITNGAGLAIGIDTLGQMNVPESGAVNPYNSTYVGLSFFTDFTGDGAPEWGDATSPGCLCEGYGVAANGTFGYADNNFAIVNVFSDSFVPTASTATVVTHINGPGATPLLSVMHEYLPSASPSLYQAIVTLTNVSGGLATDVRYNRTMDWDIPPTTFSEYVTIQGWPATALLDTCDDGFETPNPLSDCTPISAPEDANFTDENGSDHGARFTFKFGDLADGASQTFNIFYGAAPDETLALAALGTVGAEVYSFGQCNPAGPPNPPAASNICGPTTSGTPATFIFGFSGVGGTPVAPVPEPATLLLVGSGLAGAIIRRRMKKG